MKALLLTLVLIAIHSHANAATLAEKKKIAETKEALAESNDKNSNVQFKKSCGYSLPASADDGMVIAYLADNSSATAYCDSVRSVLAHMCEDATAKTEITKKVKKVACKTAKSDATFSLSGTTFEMAVAPGVSNLDEKLKTWFDANL